MKLIELVERYKGTAKFDVNSVSDGENEDVIVFTIGEHKAIKDEIMNGEVIRYSVTSLVNTTPTISILIKPEENTGGNDQKEPDETGGEDFTES